MTGIPVFRKRHPPVGSRPGTLVAPEGSPVPRIRVMRFDAEHVDEFDVANTDALDTIVRDGQVAWMDIQGLGDEPLLRRVGSTFGIHPLALEDIVNAQQRPKAEEYEQNLLLVTRMATLREGGALQIEQVAVVVGRNYVISVQESYGDCLDPVRRRLRDGLGMSRRSGPDYLAYAIIDTIVDGYYPVIDHLSTRIARIEGVVMARPSPAMLTRLNQIKAELVLIRRGIWPQQEVISRLLRDSSQFLSPVITPYLRDTHDHCSQLVDVVDSQRELVNGLMNAYLSVVSNRTNEVMKVLTIMASIFIPLTFIAGIYGMNFQNMPELSKPWAYPLVLAIMGAMALGMLVFFWRRGWLGNGGQDDSWNNED